MSSLFTKEDLAEHKRIREQSARNLRAATETERELVVIYTLTPYRAINKYLETGEGGSDKIWLRQTGKTMTVAEVARRLDRIIDKYGVKAREDITCFVRGVRPFPGIPRKIGDVANKRITSMTGRQATATYFAGEKCCYILMYITKGFKLLHLNSVGKGPPDEFVAASGGTMTLVDAGEKHNGRKMLVATLTYGLPPLRLEVNNRRSPPRGGRSPKPRTPRRSPRKTPKKKTARKTKRKTRRR